MQRKRINLLFVGLITVFLFVSCSKVPKCAKLIPDDAAFVLRVDAKQLAEKSGFSENSKIKKKITAALKDADLSRASCEKIESILEDPAKAGLDLRDPLFFYCGEEEDKSDVYAALVGAIYNKEDFTDLLNIWAKEADLDKVDDTDGVSFFAQGRTVVVFDDRFFYVGERKYNEAPKDFVADVADLFKKESKHSMLDNDNMKRMCSTNGVMQLLVNGKGFEDKRMEKALPKDLKIEDVSCLLDLSIENGEVSLIAEVLASSDGWKEQIEKGDKLFGSIEGNLLKYISKEGFAAFVNIDGEAYYDMMKEFGVFKDLSDGKRNTIRNILKSIKGDFAMDITNFNMDYGYPTISAYLQTKDNSIVKTISDENENNIKKLGDEYVLPLAYDLHYYYSNSEPSVVATMNFGYKNKVTYFVTGNNPSSFKSVSRPFFIEDLKGKRFYAYFNYAFLNKLAATMNKSEGKAVRDIAKLFDYAELYYEGKGKTIMHIVMKNKNQTPLESIIDFAMDYLDNMNKQYDESSYSSDSDDYNDDYAIVDTAAVVVEEDYD